MFRESLPDIAERWVLAIARALTPKRIGGVPGLAKMCFEELLAPDYALPDPERALDNPFGLAGIVHHLDLPTLLAGYRRGALSAGAHAAAKMVVAAAAFGAGVQRLPYVEQLAPRDAPGSLQGHLRSRF